MVGTGSDEARSTSRVRHTGPSASMVHVEHASTRMRTRAGMHATRTQPSVTAQQQHSHESSIFASRDLVRPSGSALTLRSPVAVPGGP